MQRVGAARSAGASFGCLAIVTAIVLGCGGSTPGGTVATSQRPVASVAAEAPTTPVASTTASAAADVPIINAGRCCMGVDLDAGTYRTPYTWPTGISLTVPSGWRVFSEDRTGGGVVALVRGDGNEIDHATQYVAFFPIPADEPIAAFVDDLRATPHLAAEPVEELEVGGRPAIAFDAVAEPNPDMVGTDQIVAGAISFPTIDRIYAPYKWRSETPEARVRMIVVDHGAGGLLVYLEAPTAAFDALATDAETVIDSVTFIE